MPIFGHEFSAPIFGLDTVLVMWYLIQGYVHYYNKFNEQPFDNYINELAANPLLNKMIDIRLGTLVI